MNENNTKSTEQKAPEWGIVELLGHVQMAGRLSEEPRFGTTLGRCDVPTGDGFTTRYFGGNSIYRVTITDEATAREAAMPARPYAFGARRALPAHSDDFEDTNPFENNDSIIESWEDEITPDLDDDPNFTEMSL